MTETIIGAGIEIHKTLGPGLLESVYESVLAKELTRLGLHVQRQAVLPIHWKGEILEESFRADLIVEGLVLVELKSVEKTAQTYCGVIPLRRALARMLTYREYAPLLVSRSARGIPSSLRSGRISLATNGGAAHGH